MNEIDEINLAKFSNSQHCVFMQEFDRLLTIYPVQQSVITELAATFKQALTYEDALLYVSRRSSLSKLIYDSNARRERTWSAISNMVQAYLQSPFEGEVAVGKVVSRALQNFGNVRRRNYYEKTAAIGLLTGNLMSEEYAASVEQLRLTAWVAELKRENDEFNSLMDERSNEQAKQVKGNSITARKQTDELYKKLVLKINAVINLGLSIETTDRLVAQQNQRIKEAKLSLAMHAGHLKAKKAKEEKKAKEVQEEKEAQAQ